MPITYTKWLEREKLRASTINTVGGIFINEYHKSKEREFEFGTIYQIALGEKGRGRQLLTLTTPPNCELKKGNNPDFTITKTKNGKTRISENSRHDHTQFLLLSAQGGYTRRGNGWIGKNADNTATYELLAYGNGADGDVGRIGQWDVVLLKVQGTPQNDWLRIRRSGGGYGTPPEFLYIGAKGIFYFEDIEAMQTFCDGVGIQAPNPDYETATGEWIDVTANNII